MNFPAGTEREMKSSGTIIFRCDLGAKEGWGHVSRCSALAEAARERGLESILLTSGSVGDLPDDLLEPFHCIKERWFDPGSEEGWLEAVNKRRPVHGVVIDSYDFGRRDLMALSTVLGAGKGKLVLLDDYRGEPQGEVDLMVNPGLGASSTDYGVGNRVLAGSEYALIRKCFRSRSWAAPAESESVASAIILLGGTDCRNLALKILTYLFEITGGGVEPVLIGGKRGDDRIYIEEAMGRFPRALWLESVDGTELADFFGRCRWGITTCSVTAYEMATCRLPFLGIVVAKNQEAMGEAIMERWGMPVLKSEELTIDRFRSSWSRLNEEFPSRSAEERCDYGGIDGKGAGRVVSEILDIVRGSDLNPGEPGETKRNGDEEERILIPASRDKDAKGRVTS